MTPAPIAADKSRQVSERKAIGMTDENVFDIEQGVSIGAVVARPAMHRLDSVLHGRLTGTREEKYRVLGESTMAELTTTISVTAPLYRITRSADDSDEEFDAWLALDKVMPFNSGSIITSRDNLAMDIDRGTLLQKIERFARSRKGDRSVENEIGYSAKAKWDVERCKEQIRAIKNRDEYVRTVLYRPFDRRFIFYLPSLLDTPSKPVCESVFGRENLVLLTPGVKTSSDFTHVLVSREPSEKKACSHDRATQMFPLYSYGGPLLESRTVNMIEQMTAGRDERKVFAYIYAILHSPTYRRRYGNALRDSFPRVPAVGKQGPFEELALLGDELIALHLLESSQLDRPSTTFTGLKNPGVGRVGWSHETVWLDATVARKGEAAAADTVGFRGVRDDVWNFHIGGYQVCEKWLKDRKGRTLSKGDITHYQKIIVALSETIRLMKEIEEVIQKHGGWPGAVAEKGAKAASAA